MECATCSHVLYWADTDHEFVLFHCPSSLLPSPRLGGFGKRSENQATLNYAPPRELIATALFTEDAVDTQSSCKKRDAFLALPADADQPSLADLLAGGKLGAKSASVDRRCPSRISIYITAAPQPRGNGISRTP